ncbi:MAG: F0F1 ATP synthase subunit B [Methylomonas sp.]|nr:F0F1 ATP synthase subunit B [Methylomonas sp.]
MQLDWTTFILEVINFLVLLWILQRFLYKPVMASLDARQQRIRQETASAEQLRNEAEALRLQYETRLAEWAKEYDASRHQLEAELQQTRGKALDELRKSLLDEAAKKQVRDSAVIAAHETALIREAAAEAYRQAAQMLVRLASPALTEAIVEMFLADLAALSDSELATLRKAGQALIPESLVEVRAAHALDAARQDSISQALATAAGRLLTPSFAEDAGLIAGIRVVVGECQLHANLLDELAFFRRRNRHE